VTIEWYLIRTKPWQERRVRDRLTEDLPELFLPLLKTRIRRRERSVESMVPLFPSYLFGSFDAESQYRLVRYTPGVREVVRTTGELLIVPPPIVASLKDRCVNGVVEISQPRMNKGQPVRVVEGAFRGFDAIFEGYLPGRDRIKILLSGLGATMVLRASSVEPDPEYVGHKNGGVCAGGTRGAFR
jgi:transcriptional antiterminator RfaH